MRTSARVAIRLALCLPPLLAACSHGPDGHGARVAFAADDTAHALPALGAGDVAVTSEDGTLMLALVGDTVRMQLTDSLRRKVRTEVARSAGRDSGSFGALIARSVGTVVGDAMGFVVRIPVQEIEHLRYEDGHIQFGSRGNTHVSMDGNGSDGDRGDRGSRRGHDSARFSAADGRRFVEAVERRQQELGRSRPRRDANL